MVATIDEAVATIAHLVSLPGAGNYVADTEWEMRLAGVSVAVASRDTPARYR